MGRLRVEDALCLEELEAWSETERDARLLPPDALLADLPPLALDVDSTWQLCHGQPVWRSGLRVGQTMRAYGPDGRFLGVVQVDKEGRAAPRRLVD